MYALFLYSTYIKNKFQRLVVLKGSGYLTATFLTISQSRRKKNLPKTD
jgi:hypothetical protein